MNSFINLILSLVLTLGLAQGKAQITVLVNGVPTQVEVNGSEVTAVKGELKGYMSGYANADDGFQHTDLRFGDANQTKILAAAAESKPSAPIVTTSITVDAPIVSGDYINFNNSSAELTQKAKTYMLSKAADLIAGKGKSILLETTFKSESKLNKDLANDRLNTCKTFLEENGVQSNIIVINLSPSGKKSDKVSLILR